MHTSDMVSFLRNRAQIERQMITNQLLCGDESGKMRITRANTYDAIGDHFSVVESNKINLENQIKALQNEIERMKS